MRIALYFNPDAGAQTYSAPDLAYLLRDAGHEVELFQKGRHAMRKAVNSSPAVLVAAGGDGTVSKAAIALAARAPHVPLFVLPVGTSNNIATTLGGALRGTVMTLVQSLADARPVPIDIGVAIAPWGEESFVEAAGVGFFGAALHDAESLSGRLRTALRSVRRPTQGEAEVRAAARGMAALIRGCPVRRHSVVADGLDLSGEYLAVEVMNIRVIGPRMWLAPDAAYGDGWLDLVLMRPEARDSLARLTESGDPRDACCEVHRAREVELSWPWREGHVDDSPWPERQPRGGAIGRVRVGIRGSIQVLLPQPR